MALVFPEGTMGRPERPDRLSYIKVSEELDARIKQALDEWVLRVSYTVTYEDEDDDRPSTYSDVRYKELYEPYIVVSNEYPIGVMLKHTIYENGGSNCTYTDLYVLYFCDAGVREIELEGVRCGRNYVEGCATYSLRRRSELPENTKVDTASTQFIPVPNVM